MNGGSIAVALRSDVHGLADLSALIHGVDSLDILPHKLARIAVPQGRTSGERKV